MQTQDTSRRVEKAIHEIDEAKKTFEKLMRIQKELNEAYQDILKERESSSGKGSDKSPSPPPG